tara:strand:+ start:2394 stop:3071 length:678 start_codon:yes stop_codon:yes gene_type:complete
MAAGRGERMLPLTRAIPKPMAPLLSGTLLKYGYEQLHSTIDNICITVGHHGALLADYSIKLGINTIINSSNKGNAWWIFNSLLKHLDEPVLVLTADNITVIEYTEIYSDFVNIPNAACMLVGVDPLDGVDGDFIFVENDHSSVVTSLSRTAKSDSYASGIQVLNPSLVNKLCQGPIFKSDSVSFSDVWSSLISSRSLFKSSIIPKKWFSVDTLAQLSDAEKYIQH